MFLFELIFVATAATYLIQNWLALRWIYLTKSTVLRTGLILITTPETGTSLYIKHTGSDSIKKQTCSIEMYTKLHAACPEVLCVVVLPLI